MTTMTTNRKGYYADDGNQEVYYDDADSHAEAADRYVNDDNACWCEDSTKINVTTWPACFTFDQAQQLFETETTEVEIRR